MKTIQNSILIIFLLFGNFISQKSVAQTNVSFEGIKKINGTDLYCKVIGKGEPLLIIHGGPGLNYEYFLPFLEPLSKKYKLIFYDQRSSGKSIIPQDSNDVTFTKFIDDIEGVRKEFGLEKVNLFSHSFGTKLALNYALKYPNQVKSIIFCDAISFSNEFDSLLNVNQANKTTQEYLLERKKITNSNGYKLGFVKDYEQLLKLSFKLSFFDISKVNLLNLALQKDFIRASKSLQKGLSIDLDNYDYDYYPSLITISVPVLIIHGRSDIIPVESDIKLKNSIANSQLVIFEKSGHFPFVEENERFISVINLFLK